MILSVVIPVYNEKNTIETIIDKVLAISGIQKEIIVVDDASKDGTNKILKSYSLKHPNIIMIYKATNEGKGAALRDGFNKATGDLVIVQDADMEYDPSDYSKLIKQMEKGSVVYGSRFLAKTGNIYTTHYAGNKFLTLITNLLFGTKLTDMETCYKLLPIGFVRSVTIESKRFNFEPEITAKILKTGLKIKEVPITYNGRTFREGKKITWKDGFSALSTLIRFRFF